MPTDPYRLEELLKREPDILDEFLNSPEGELVPFLPLRNSLDRFLAKLKRTIEDIEDNASRKQRKSGVFDRLRHQKEQLRKTIRMVERKLKIKQIGRRSKPQPNFREEHINLCNTLKEFLKRNYGDYVKENKKYLRLKFGDGRLLEQALKCFWLEQNNPFPYKVIANIDARLSKQTNTVVKIVNIILAEKETLETNKRVSPLTIKRKLVNQKSNQR